MQVTTLTGETVTLVMPFQFGHSPVRGAYDPWFYVYIKTIGKDQWWKVQSFEPGYGPVLSEKVTDVDELALLNAQIQETNKL